MDAANVDLKAFSKRFYEEVCGASLNQVLDTLCYLKHDTEVWFELTTLLIPGENDNKDEIDKMTRWVVQELDQDVPMHFTAFHPNYKMLDKPGTYPGSLTRAQEIAIANGVRFAYTGNVHDEAGSSTYCCECGNKIIGRDWYLLTRWELDETGRCLFCGTQCPGVFDGPPGTWGRKRKPVRLDGIG